LTPAEVREKKHSHESQGSRGVDLLSVLGSGAVVAVAQPEVDVPQQMPSVRRVNEAELPPAERARRAKVVAKVGDVRITVGEVEDSVNAQSPFLRQRYTDPAHLREFVENMIRFELLAAEAQKKGYADDPLVLRTTKQNAVQHMIRVDFDERITAESVPEADVRAYYDSHETEFHRPEMVRASHILVATREEATQLIAQLREGDARAFRQAAREHSIDTETKLRGGDLRYFTREGQSFQGQGPEIDRTIVDAAFALREVGDVTPAPVQVGEHFSVVKLTGRRPAEHRTFEESDPAIRLRLWRERRQSALDELITELRERYQPEVHEERVEPITLDPLPEPAPGEHGEEGEGAPNIPSPAMP
jgi:peptidyl-prolyl cis-trans isomerase C